MILVLLTLLSSLFFSTLFFVQPVTPACTSSEEPACSAKSYICPSCYELHGVADCGDRAGKNPSSSVGLELPRTSNDNCTGLVQIVGQL